jgi:hypothetical protein
MRIRHVIPCRRSFPGLPVLAGRKRRATHVLVGAVLRQVRRTAGPVLVLGHDSLRSDERNPGGQQKLRPCRERPLLSDEIRWLAFALGEPTVGTTSTRSGTTKRASRVRAASIGRIAVN